MLKFIKKQIDQLKQLIGISWRATKLAWSYYPGSTLGTIIVSLFIALLPFAQSGTSALLVNNLVAAATRHTGLTHILLILAFVYITIGFLPDILFSLQTLLQKRNFIGLGEKFQLMVLRKKAEIDIQSYENPAFQDLVNKVDDRDIWPMTNLLETQFTNIQNVVQVIVALTILVTVNIWLCVAVIIAILPNFAVQIRYSEDTWGIWHAETAIRRRYYDMKKHFSEQTWLVELKLFQNVAFFYDRIKMILENFNRKQMQNEVTKLRWSLVTTVFLGVIVGGVSFWIINQVAIGVMEVGTMLFVFTAIDRLQSAFAGFFSSIARQHEWSLYTKSVFELLDTKPALYRPKTPIKLDQNISPEIIFENVSFAYPRNEYQTLKNISLTINAGEKFALVGENGAGKTTFVKLLCRIYDPTEGRILVNGHNLRDIDLDSWNYTLGVLFQDYATYSMPVKEAIAIGRSQKELSMNEVVVSAQASESESFIKQWKDQYDQMLGVEFEGGIDPSKGQNQRLAIARLMHRKAGLMILDEPTAAIDAEAEMKIFDKIESLSEGQTVVLISHKFSTVRRADRICVFKDGTVEEIGSHKDLIKKGGLYATLFKMQAEDYK